MGYGTVYSQYPTKQKCHSPEQERVDLNKEKSEKVSLRTCPISGKISEMIVKYR